MYETPCYYTASVEHGQTILVNKSREEVYEISHSILGRETWDVSHHRSLTGTILVDMVLQRFTMFSPWKKKSG